MKVNLEQKLNSNLGYGREMINMRTEILSWMKIFDQMVVVSNLPLDQRGSILWE